MATAFRYIGFIACVGCIVLAFINAFNGDYSKACWFYLIGAISPIDHLERFADKE